MEAAKSRPHCSSTAFVFFSIGEGSLMRSLVLVKAARGSAILERSATQRRYAPHILRKLFIGVWDAGYRSPHRARRFSA